ncbi:MAG: hypothetical protein WBD20_17680 [Pirellulaceae bacterium]
MTKLRKFIRGIVVWTWRFVVVAIVFFNARLYWPSPLAQSRDEVPPTLVAQLAANRSAIDTGTPEQMQRLFPEGFYFCYVLHGLTWVELALRDDSFSEQAIAEALECLSELNSPAGRQPFPRSLPPEHGMFYSAWKCSLRAGVVLLQQGRDPDQLDALRRECDAIRDAIANSETPFLASYIDSAWPCDTVPAIHAMSTCDFITNENRYGDVVAQWLRDTRDRLDAETGLLPHTASLPDGQRVGVARATSQVICLRLLADIDAVFAKDQYERFRKRFLTSFVGAPCVLEYPSGVAGSGDIDSGPLIFGRSIAGTVLMMAVAQVYGDQSLANAIAQSGETVGLPWTSGGQKDYVGGALPIGDIIVAYAHVARPWLVQHEHHPDTEFRVATYWRWQIHAWSLLVMLPLAIGYFRRKQRSRAGSAHEASVASVSLTNRQ